MAKTLLTTALSEQLTRSVPTLKTLGYNISEFCVEDAFALVQLRTAFLKNGISGGSDGAHLHCTGFITKDRFILAQQNAIFVLNLSL